VATLARRTTNTDGKPWAIYARLSKAATGDLEKVEYQEELCREYAEYRELPISEDHVYRDPNLSAWKKGVRRKEWDRMMAAAERGDIAGILVYAVDRFTRRPKDLETLIELAEDHGLMIEGPRSGRLDLTTATGRQQARWMAMQAASESDNTSERIKATLAHKMQAGKPMGGGRSYGFEVVGDRHAIEVPQRPAEVAAIREIAGRMLAGEPLQHLAADMNARGLRTVRGGEWNGANLGRMLGQARYGGLVEHDREIVARMPGKPVLDEDTYQGVQALLASRRRGRRPTGRFLLTGLAAHGGHIAIMSPEGGVFDTFAGRYSSGVPNLDTLLKGWSAEPVRVDRRGARQHHDGLDHPADYPRGHRPQHLVPRPRVAGALPVRAPAQQRRATQGGPAAGRSCDHRRLHHLRAAARCRTRPMGIRPCQAHYRARRR